MWILAILVRNLTIVLLTEPFLGIIFGAKTERKIITVILVNIITNPAVVLSALSLTIFFNRAEDIGLLFLELLAILVEGFMFQKFKTFDNKNPYLISLVVNMVSFTAGKIINIL